MRRKRQEARQGSQKVSEYWGSITPPTTSTICHHLVKSGGPTFISQHDLSQFHGWNWTYTLVWSRQCSIMKSSTPHTFPNSNNSCNFNSTTSTRHWLQLRLGKHNYCICERGFSKHSRVKSDRTSRSKLETLDALMRVSLSGLPMENMDWAKILALGNRPKSKGLCLWSWMMIKRIM